MITIIFGLFYKIKVFNFIYKCQMAGIIDEICNYKCGDGLIWGFLRFFTF
jgi:hypothetical protein